MGLVHTGLIVMQTYDTIAQVADDAARRVRRVVCFFQSLFVVLVACAIAIDLTPSPRLECHKESAQMMSPYPHPYGLPPVGTWSVCEWNPPR